jgi:hypothetical protein
MYRQMDRRVSKLAFDATLLRRDALRWADSGDGGVTEYLALIGLGEST